MKTLTKAEIHCKASKSGVCLAMSEGFWPGCTEGECDYSTVPAQGGSVKTAEYEQIRATKCPHEDGCSGHGCLRLRHNEGDCPAEAGLTLEDSLAPR